MRSFCSEWAWIGINNVNIHRHRICTRSGQPIAYYSWSPWARTSAAPVNAYRTEIVRPFCSEWAWRVPAFLSIPCLTCSSVAIAGNHFFISKCAYPDSAVHWSWHTPLIALNLAIKMAFGVKPHILGAAENETQFTAIASSAFKRKNGNCDSRA